jgi:hypothetical protein
MENEKSEKTIETKMENEKITIKEEEEKETEKNVNNNRNTFVAKIKKEYLITKEKLTGEKRKENESEIEEGKKTKKHKGMNKNRFLDHTPTQFVNEEQTKNIHHEDELNIVPYEIKVQLSKKKYEFKLDKEITPKVEKFVSEYNEVVGNVKKMLNREYPDYVESKLKPNEIKKVDFKNKLYLAPLTTVGNLPFRRICVDFGVDITCGEMALTENSIFFLIKSYYRTKERIVFVDKTQKRKMLWYSIGGYYFYLKKETNFMKLSKFQSLSKES